MRLLVPYLAEGAYDGKDAAPTLQWLQANSETLKGAGLEVVIPELKLGVTSYEDRLREEWERKEGFLVLEPYVLPESVEALRAIAGCARDLCVAPYEVHQEYWPPDRGRPRYAGTSCSRGLCDPAPSAWFIAEGGLERPIRTDDTRAHSSGFGLIRFSARLMDSYPKLELPQDERPIPERFWALQRAHGRIYYGHLHWAGDPRGTEPEARRLLTARPYHCAAFDGG